MRPGRLPLFVCVLALGTLPGCQPPAMGGGPATQPFPAAPAVAVPPVAGAPTGTPAAPAIGPTGAPKPAAVSPTTPPALRSRGGGGTTSPLHIRGDVALADVPLASAAVRVYEAGQTTLLAEGATDAAGAFDLALPRAIRRGTALRILVSGAGGTLAGLGFAGEAPTGIAAYRLLAGRPPSITEGTTLALLLNPNIEQSLAATNRGQGANTVAIRLSFTQLATTSQETLDQLHQHRDEAADDATTSAQLTAALNFVLGAFTDAFADGDDEEPGGSFTAPRLSNADHGDVVAVLVFESQTLSEGGGDDGMSALEAMVLEVANAVNAYLVEAAQEGDADVPITQLVSVSFGGVTIAIPPAEIFEPLPDDHPPPRLGGVKATVRVRDGETIVDPIVPAPPRPDFPALPPR